MKKQHAHLAMSRVTVVHFWNLLNYFGSMIPPQSIILIALFRSAGNNTRRERVYENEIP